MHSKRGLVQFAPHGVNAHRYEAKTDVDLTGLLSYRWYIGFRGVGREIGCSWAKALVFS